MPCAILQTSLEPPAVESLARAFAVLPQLTEYDAHSMAKDAFGILVQDLASHDAERLMDALRAEGVEVEVVDQERLPPLPQTNPIRRAECLPEAFVAYDHLDRPNGIDWSHVILLAAGAVRRTEFEHITRERLHHYDQDGSPVTVTEHRDREVERLRLMLEVFLDVAPGRFHIAAERFNYAYLGKRLHPGRVRNYLSLVQDCLLHAPRAVLNRGAESVRQGARTMFAYPSRHAFEEESVWLLWRHFASRRDSG